MTDNLITGGLVERRQVIEGVEVRVTSYQVGKRYACRIDNIDPGTIIGRGRGATRAEAESAALAGATVKLGLSQARSALRKSLEHLADERPPDDDDDV